MGNKRDCAISIVVTSDNAVDTKKTSSAIQQELGNSKRSEKSARPQSWNLQVPGSSESYTTTDTEKAGNQSPRRSTSPRRQRHSSGDSIKSTRSEGDIKAYEKRATGNKTWRKSSLQLNRSTECLASGASDIRHVSSKANDKESLNLRVPRRPKSCNPLRSASHYDELLVIPTGDSDYNARDVTRPRSWCGTRDRSDTHDTHLVDTDDAALTRVKSDNILTGQTISHFYKIWSLPSKDRVLGRGKLALPNSLKRQEKYRPCGCLSRHHVEDADSEKSCSHHR